MRARLRRFWLVPGAAVLALLLSSCFVLQGFVLVVGSIEPGDKTTARFSLRPFASENTREFQFVLVGVPSGGEVTVGKATWGTNGKFAGPLGMTAESGLDEALIADGSCDGSGLEFADITGTSWKGFMTPKSIRTRGLVDQKAVTDVVLKATSGAGGNYLIFGVTGIWEDDGNGTVGAEDTFDCMGISSAGLYVDAPV